MCLGWHSTAGSAPSLWTQALPSGAELPHTCLLLSWHSLAPPTSPLFVYLADLMRVKRCAGVDPVRMLQELCLVVLKDGLQQAG